jgi:hypothetical protein
MGFGVDDHRIRRLMSLSKMTSRELWKEDVEQVGGSPIWKEGFCKAFLKV